MSTLSLSVSYKDRTMNTIKLISLLLFGLAFFSGCSDEDVVETDAELVPYFELFAEEAAKRGFFVDYEAERIEGLIQDIPDAAIQGQCFFNERIPRKVIIDVDYWNNATKLEKEFIIYHELGHCFLDRNHLDEAMPDGTCVSIMHSSPGVCFFEMNSNNRDFYLDELFFQ